MSFYTCFDWFKKLGLFDNVLNLKIDVVLKASCAVVIKWFSLNEAPLGLFQFISDYLPYFEKINIQPCNITSRSSNIARISDSKMATAHISRICVFYFIVFGSCLHSCISIHFNNWSTEERSGHKRFAIGYRKILPGLRWISATNLS
jgi:hypothetical protein